MKKTFLITALFFAIQASAQEEIMSLTLRQAIEIAQEYSPEAEAARHTYRSAYWSYRFYQANYLPSVTLTSSPYFNKQISKDKCGFTVDWKYPTANILIPITKSPRKYIRIAVGDIARISSLGFKKI